jgi:hypothetical protein
MMRTIHWRLVISVGQRPQAVDWALALALVKERAPKEASVIMELDPKDQEYVLTAVWTEPSIS